MHFQEVKSSGRVKWRLRNAWVWLARSRMRSGNERSMLGVSPLLLCESSEPEELSPRWERSME